MCYSAMVKQDMKAIARQFGANVDVEAFTKLYAMRLKMPELKIPVGMDRFFLIQSDEKFNSIRASIEMFNKLEDDRCRQELSDLEAEILELETRLKVKVTKTNQNQLAIKGRKREKLLDQLKRLTKNESVLADYRIYPKYFAPVIVAGKKDRLLVPMRYRILPATGVDLSSDYNLFNARRDSLQSKKTWKPLFGEKHALFPFLKFYEWVESKSGIKQELSFSPDNFQSMWASSLFEEFKSPHGSVFSFAMVTDEPPPEVAAAGHDRCPVFLEEQYIERWLHPAKLSIKELDGLLEHKQQTYFSHQRAA